MKVALLSDCYPPRLGGIEVQVHDLAAHLSARGHQVEVFTATPGAEGQRHGQVEQVDGIAVHRLALHLPWDLPVNPLAPRTLKDRLAGFDVAHVHMGVVSPFAVDCTRVATRMGLPLAMTWHCMLDRFTPVARLLGGPRRWGAAGTAMSAVSEVAATSVRQAVGPEAVVTVLPNGIDVDRWRPETQPPGDGVVRVVTAMRLALRKRPLPFLRVIKRVRELAPAGVRLRVEVFGEGPDRAKVERFLVENGMRTWVDLPGRVPREQLRDRYAAADVYVSPARLESFGIAALEARTVGLPVVARLGSGVGEFVSDGVNGYLSPTDEGMAHAIARLAADPRLRDRMRQHNLSTSPAQDWPEVAAQAEREYERALSAVGRRA